MTEREKILKELISFGFTEDSAEKALTESKGNSADDVLEWIEEQGDPLMFEEIVGKRVLCSQGEIKNNRETTSNNEEKYVDLAKDDSHHTLVGDASSKKELTPEEIQQKVMELKRKIQERNKEKEKDEIEKERKRLSAMKELQEKRRLLEEQEKKMFIESTIREKIEHAKEKERQLQKFKMEYKERFGIEYKETKKPKKIEELSENEKREEIGFLINKIRTTYKDKKKDVIASLNILKTYFMNIKNNIIEKKYQTIKKENKIFSEKIKIYEDMVQVMLFVGFVDSGDVYTIKGVPNTYLLSNAVRFIDLAIRNFDQ